MLYMCQVLSYNPMTNWAGAMIRRDQSYNQHEVGEQGVSRSRGRDECVDGSIGSGSKCCYGVKSEKEQASLGNWLWRVSQLGKKRVDTLCRGMEPWGVICTRSHLREWLSYCPGAGLDGGLGFMLEEIAGKASTVLGCDIPSWLYISPSLLRDDGCDLEIS